jgi:hypothetical protein
MPGVSEALIMDQLITSRYTRTRPSDSKLPEREDYSHAAARPEGSATLFGIERLFAKIYLAVRITLS